MRKESCGAEPEKGIPRSHLQLKLSSASPLREEFTLLPLAQASGRYERPSSCLQGFCKLRLYFRIDELRDVVSNRRAPPDPAERCASCAKTPGMVATRGRGPERPYVPGSTPALGGAVPLARRS